MIATLIAGIEDLSDREFITELFERYGRLMFSTAAGFTSDAYMKEDIVQDALVRLISKVSTLRALEERALVSYVAVTVKNTAISQLRRDGRELANRFFTDDDGDALEIPDGSSSVIDKIILRDELGKLADIWPRLKESEQFILESKYIGGYSDEELARAMGCRESSIRMMLTRARRHALQELEKVGVTNG